MKTLENIDRNMNLTTMGKENMLEALKRHGMPNVAAYIADLEEQVEDIEEVLHQSDCGDLKELSKAFENYEIGYLEGYIHEDNLQEHIDMYIDESQEYIHYDFIEEYIDNHLQDTYMTVEKHEELTANYENLADYFDKWLDKMEAVEKDNGDHDYYKLTGSLERELRHYYHTEIQDD